MKKSTVLLVEDDQSIRQLYTDALTISGLEVISAGNGKEGIELALEHHPNLILADLMMPQMNGIEMMEKIRLDNWGKTARVIFLTNFSEPDQVYNAVQLKPEEYIVKSHAEIKEVVNKVRAAILS